MMTVRISTGQNDLGVALGLLELAYNHGVNDMRTKWFSISPTAGLRWKDLDFCDMLLGQVVKKLMNRTDVSVDEFLFASYIGIKFDDAMIEDHPNIDFTGL